MKRSLTIIATTCVVGFGVWFGLFILTTVHGLVGEANEPLFWTLSNGSRVCGLIAGVFWAVRRIRRRAVAFPELVIFCLGAVSLYYLVYLTIL